MIKKNNKGFTLVEMSTVLAIAGSIAIVSAQEDKFEVSQDKSRAMGNELFQYNAAVSRYLAANASDGSSITGSQTGSNWLKGPGCSGGTADKSYLDCAVMPDNHTIQYGSTPRTTISQDADGALTARTVWDTVTGDNGNPDTMAMGIAALIASGNYVSQAGDAAAGYQAPTLFCPETAGASASISTACGTDRNAIVSLANTNATVEPWLRRDHGNTMEHVIEFDNGTGEPSSEADLASVDGDNWRQMVNVSRIYNIGASGNDSIVLGKMYGSTLSSDAFASTYSLLENAVIADGNLGVMNDIYVKSNAFVNGDIEIGGSADIVRDASIGRHLTVDGDSLMKGDARVKEDLQVDGYASFGKDAVVGRHLTTNGESLLKGKVETQSDLIVGDNTSIARDASIGRHLTVDGDTMLKGRVRAEDRLRVDGNLYISKIVDFDDSDRVVDPSGVTAINELNIWGRTNVISDFYLDKKVNQGSYCNKNGKIARSKNGRILNCVGNAWSSAGGGIKISLNKVYGRTSSDTSMPASWDIGVHSFCTMNGILHYAGSDDNFHVLDVRKGAAVGDKFRWYYRNGAESSGTKVRVTCYSM